MIYVVSKQPTSIVEACALYYRNEETATGERPSGMAMKR